MINDGLFDTILSLSGDAPPGYHDMIFDTVALNLGKRSRQMLMQAWSDNFMGMLQDYTHRCFGVDLHSLVTVPVYLAPTPHCAAQIIVYKNDPVIVFSQGLLTFFSFYAEAGTIIMIQQQILIRTQKAFGPHSSEAKSTTELIRMFQKWTHGFCYLYQLEQLQLPGLRNAFTPHYAGRVVSRIVEMELFALLHEVAHIRLKHLTDQNFWSVKSDGTSGFVNHYLSLQPCNSLQQAEMEADVLACRLLGESSIQPLFMGAIGFLSTLGCYEIAFGINIESHPFAIARITNLLREFEADISESDLTLVHSSLQFLKQDFVTFWQPNLLSNLLRDTLGVSNLAEEITKMMMREKIIAGIFDDISPEKAVMAMAMYANELGQMLRNYGDPVW